MRDTPTGHIAASPLKAHLPQGHGPITELGNACVNSCVFLFSVPWALAQWLSTILGSIDLINSILNSIRSATVMFFLQRCTNREVAAEWCVGDVNDEGSWRKVALVDGCGEFASAEAYLKSWIASSQANLIHFLLAGAYYAAVHPKQHHEKPPETD